MPCRFSHRLSRDGIGAKRFRWKEGIGAVRRSQILEQVNWPAPGGLSMYVNRERVVYAGLLGKPEPRRFGALALYFTPGSDIEVQIGDGAWERRPGVAVPSNVVHNLRAENGIVGAVLIEAESITDEAAQQLVAAFADRPAETSDRLRAAFERYLTGEASGFDTLALDDLFLGGALPVRRMDRRIEAACDLIVAEPWERLSAEACADAAGLSFTHFLHLFKKEAGLPFRTFCAWKRARLMLPQVQSNKSLTDMAMDAGYPDSTHFSHSIRRVYGLKPSDIVSGSKRLKVHDAEASPSPAIGRGQ